MSPIWALQDTVEAFRSKFSQGQQNEVKIKEAGRMALG